MVGLCDTTITFKSGRTDLNRRPLQPHCSALAKLGHAPSNGSDYTTTLLIVQGLTAHAMHQARS